MRTFAPLAFILLASTLSAQEIQPSHAFDYDQNAPLDIQEVLVEHRGDISVHDISYASPKGGRVPAYLVVPPGKGPFAAVLWGHWYWPNSEFFNRKEFLDETVVLAQAGVVSLLTTGPGARPGHVQDRTPLNEQQISDLIQAIVDLRRGADLLLARKDVDPQRLAYEFELYEAPHALNAEARRNRIAFLTEQLKLKALSPTLIGSIPELPQPPAPNP
jgi:hypothetical protein